MAGTQCRDRVARLRALLMLDHLESDDDAFAMPGLGKFLIGSDDQGNIDMSKLESRLFDMKSGEDWE